MKKGDWVKVHSGTTYERGRICSTRRTDDGIRAVVYVKADCLGETCGYHDVSIDELVPDGKE